MNGSLFNDIAARTGVCLPVGTRKFIKNLLNSFFSSPEPIGEVIELAGNWRPSSKVPLLSWEM